MEDFNYRVCVDTSPLMEKQWAMKSGIGWIGKHTNLITRDYGSWLFLSEILIDKKIEPDQIYSEDLCGTCTKCIDDCPTGAIIAPYVLDNRKCISYLTIELRGMIPGPLAILAPLRLDAEPGRAPSSPPCRPCEPAGRTCGVGKAGWAKRGGRGIIIPAQSARSPFDSAA